jgi:sphingolipid delta-4 desaturase
MMKPETAKPTHFSYSSSPEPHKIRTKEILKNHPEIRNYVGKNPFTFLWIVGIVAGQIGLAFWLQNQPWW